VGTLGVGYTQICLHEQLNLVFLLILPTIVDMHMRNPPSFLVNK